MEVHKLTHVSGGFVFEHAWIPWPLAWNFSRVVRRDGPAELLRDSHILLELVHDALSVCGLGEDENFAAVVEVVELDVDSEELSYCCFIFHVEQGLDFIPHRLQRFRVASCDEVVHIYRKPHDLAVVVLVVEVSLRFCYPLPAVGDQLVVAVVASIKTGRR